MWQWKTSRGLCSFWAVSPRYLKGSFHVTSLTGSIVYLKIRLLQIRKKNCNDPTSNFWTYIIKFTDLFYNVYHSCHKLPSWIFDKKQSKFNNFFPTPYPSVLDFWKIEFETFFKNQVGRTWFLVYFKLDFCRPHRQ